MERRGFLASVGALLSGLLGRAAASGWEGPPVRKFVVRVPDGISRWREIGKLIGAANAVELLGNPPMSVLLHHVDVCPVFTADGSRLDDLTFTLTPFTPLPIAPFSCATVDFAAALREALPDARMT